MLEYLNLSLNNFSGGIPESFKNLQNLKLVDLSSNLLNGEIPESLFEIPHLEEVYLNNNSLSGSIPTSIGNITQLVTLDVNSNQLSGTIPMSIGNCSKLEFLYLERNQLHGIIPESLNNLKNLQELYLDYNNLEGELPFEMTELKHLKNISLFNNRFSGVIPQSLGINSRRCTTLTRVRLEGNNFTGPLPDFETNPNLSYMSINNNNISGAIPSSLGNCTNLSRLYLSMNSLSGLVPSELGNLVNLRTLDLSHNHLEENHFSGGIPAFLSEFKRLNELRLGGNMFGGNIPKSIGELVNLMYELNLSANGLTGELPREIGNLKSLLKLDLSWNNLTGSIQVLNELTSLSEFNISFNSFEGTVPQQLIMIPNSYSSFLGNPGLCASFSSDGSNFTERSYLRPCDTNSKNLGKVATVMIALGSSIFFVLLLGLIYIFFIRKIKQEAIITEKDDSPSLLSKVMEATENLNDQYIIGKGAQGVVYKAALGPDNILAIKKFVFADDEGKSSSMTREILTLGKIRHRNLVKLEGCWLRENYGLISYRYMPNGSLHDALHGRNPPHSLEWNVRHKIAVGVAHGLAYLHYDCDPVIVHRDIKTSNVLLDSEMEPHITDFGIAKLLDQPSTSTQSASVTGTPGYIAPENAYTTTMGKESDVYSYGVVLLELISRKKALDPSFMEGTDVVNWARSLWEEMGVVDEIVDSGLAGEISNYDVMKQVTKVLLMALRCTEKDPRRRPTMRDVIKHL
uniref:non-specific serine/threonine protein kinase n=1 Tax=Cajanus cajan TaxID=3821 RepID=A0A151T0Y5_CAJCA|nr:Receptor-like protein kinase [Cajanus cajan]